MLFYVVFVYASGLAVRIGPAATLPDGGLLPMILTSLGMDSLLIGLVFAFATRILDPLSRRLPMSLLIPAALALAFVSGGVTAYLSVQIRKLSPLGPQEYFQMSAVLAYYAMLSALCYLQYITVQNARLAADNALAAAEAGRLAALSELRRLRTQIQPHFLFNVLNNIHAELAVSPSQAGTMLTMLGDHLRNALELEDTLFVSLEADLLPIRSFIALQQMRFETQITLAVDLKRQAAARRVPTFLLLPLVENATKFAHRTTGEPIDIRIEADTDGPKLTISVSNPGSLSTRAEVPGTQTGLANLRARLALHYPDRHHFSLTEQDNRVTARIEVEGEPC